MDKILDNIEGLYQQQAPPCRTTQTAAAARARISHAIKRCPQPNQAFSNAFRNPI
jgi:hypothetical protein